MTANAQPSTIWNISAALAANFARVEAILRRIESNDQQPMAQIAAAAEIRHHIALAEKTLATATAAEETRRFRDFVIDCLEQANIPARRRAITLLNAPPPAESV